MVQVVAMDDDGPVAESIKDAKAPRIRVADPKAKLGMGQRALVQLTDGGNAEAMPTAKILKVFAEKGDELVGVVSRQRKSVYVTPANKSARRDLLIPNAAADLEDGDLVKVRMTKTRHHGPAEAEILEVIGHQDDVRAASLLAMAEHEIPMSFGPEVEAEAKAACDTPLDGEDLTHLPLITIDPPDARDHDDAVWATPDPDPKNKGGLIIWSAIADVARYVRPGSALDDRAQDKGISVYFPDRVEPMLPHSLSSDVCSLKPDVERACLAVKLVLDKTGEKRAHSFHRGIMRSRARLSYAQAQAAFDGHPDDAAAPWMDEVLHPLKQAYDLLQLARQRRSPLEIHSPERTIHFDDQGHVDRISPRQQFAAHRLIEDIMILSNVAAAETLEQHHMPLIYRVHDMPGNDKLLNLSEVLGAFGLKWNHKEPPTTKRFNALLAQTKGTPEAEILNEVILRTQSQAIYSSDNIGHYGLALPRYAHFTSPIRRYADVIVHRGLIRALGLGDDGLTDREISRLEQIAEAVTGAERRAVAAERSATDRYLASYLSNKVGAEFTGIAVGVTRHGLFVRLDDIGADGLLPSRALGRQFQFFESHHAFVNAQGQAYRLGDHLEVRLEDAMPLTGGLILTPLSAPSSHVELKSRDFQRQRRDDPGRGFRRRRRR